MQICGNWAEGPPPVGHDGVVVVSPPGRRRHRPFSNESDLHWFNNPICIGSWRPWTLATSDRPQNVGLEQCSR